MFRKAQISVEHMFILMLAVMILVPGTVLFYQFAKGSSDQMIASQVKRIGDELIKNSDTVYFLGDGSRMTISLNLPRTLKNISLENEEIVITFTTYTGQSEAVFFPDISIKGYYEGKIAEQFHTGPIRIMISNNESTVVLQEITG
ncbi:MAG: hypothetical protein V1743_01875 [Nanoarchaeota archaeon]